MDVFIRDKDGRQLPTIYSVLPFHVCQFRTWLRLRVYQLYTVFSKLYIEVRSNTFCILKDLRHLYNKYAYTEWAGVAVNRPIDDWRKYNINAPVSPGVFRKKNKIKKYININVVYSNSRWIEKFYESKRSE